MLHDIKIIGKEIEDLLEILQHKNSGNIRQNDPHLFEQLLIRLAEEIKKGVERQGITGEYFISLSNEKLNKIKNGMMESNRSTIFIRKQHPELMERLRKTVTDLKAYMENHAYRAFVEEDEEDPDSPDEFTSILNYLTGPDEVCPYLDFLVECWEEDIEELKSILPKY